MYFRVLQPGNIDPDASRAWSYLIIYIYICVHMIDRYVDISKQARMLVWCTASTPCISAPLLFFPFVRPQAFDLAIVPASKPRRHFADGVRLGDAFCRVQPAAAGSERGTEGH